jgi:hypothetical protein
MTRLILSSCLLLAGCCSSCREPEGCVPSGQIELAPDGSILTVAGPATLEDARTGYRLEIPAGETWRSVPTGWERVR